MILKLFSFQGGKTVLFRDNVDPLPPKRKRLQTAPQAPHRARRAGAAVLAVAVLGALGLGLFAWQRGGAGGGVRLHFGRPVQRHVVAVDSGHGGADVGARGLVAETTVTQATAAALLALLEADPAYCPVAVHPPEQKLSPSQRVEVAR